MNFDYSEKVQELQKKLSQFMNEYVYPNEKLFHEQIDKTDPFSKIPPIMDELKEEAKQHGLWNLFLPECEFGAGLTNLEYAPLCEIMGRSAIAPEVFNCAAPGTGNCTRTAWTGKNSSMYENNWGSKRALEKLCKRIQSRAV